MRTKTCKGQTYLVLVSAVILVTLCIGGLWAYIKSANAETGVQETGPAEIPNSNEINVTLEKYDNYPLASPNAIDGWYNGKPLREAEIDRLPELMKEYKEGLRPEKNAPSLPDEFYFAIVPLNPSDFGGMTEYYLLPPSTLTDQQLLMLIAYGYKTGKPFSEDTLTVRNCVRGFNTYSNRYLSAGEHARRDNLLNRVMMEGLRPESPELTLQKLPVSGAGSIRLNQEVTSIYDTFHFYPIREMTDEELLQSLYLNSIDGYTYLNPAQQSDLSPAKDEAKMRSFLEDMMGMPMSAANTCLSYKQKDTTGEVHLHAKYKSALINGIETDYMVIVQTSSGNILYALRLTSNLANPYSPEADDPPLPSVNLKDPRWTDIAKEMVSKLTCEEIKSARAAGMSTMGDNKEAVVSVDVSMSNGDIYCMHIRVSDGTLMSAQCIPGNMALKNKNIW